MSQTSIIGGALFLAYVIFVIVRGELPCYFQVVGIATDAACPLGAISSSGLGGTSGVGVSTGSTGVGSSNSGGGYYGGLGGLGNPGQYGCPYGYCDDGSCADSDGYCGGL